jgi:hypothetical protein
MTVTKNLVAEQGTTFYEYMELVDSMGSPISPISPTPEDPANEWVVFGQVQKTYTSANITTVFNVSPVNGAGNVVIRLESNVTSLMEPGRYVYNLFAKVFDRTEKLREGTLTVNPSTLATGLQFTGYAGNAVPQFVINKITDVSSAIINDRISNVLIQLQYAAVYSNSYEEFRARILAL